MKGIIKIVVCCRNRLLRESITRILTRKSDLEIILAQGSYAISRDEIVDSGASVLVLDSLEFLLEETESARGKFILDGSLKSVLIAMDDDQDIFLAAVRGGARGYVLQEASAVDVVAAVRAVADGQAVCPPNYIGVLFDYVSKQADQWPNGRKRAQWGLTRREQQLIPLIEQGLSNKEIANHLNLSEQTVKNHVHRILRKVGVPDRLGISEARRTQLLSQSRSSQRLMNTGGWTTP